MTDHETETQAPESQTMDELLKASEQKMPTLKKGDVVTGHISSITESHIIISLGVKQDGYAEIGDYLDGGNLPYKVGDEIKGFIVRMSDEQIVIAKSLNRSHGNKVLLREAFEKQIPVKGKVIETRKGGYQVDVFGLRAFCPNSHMDLPSSSNMAPEYYLHQTFDFDVLEFQKGNVILSRKNLLQRDVAVKKENVFSRINVGDVITGKITRIANFGAFVDIGGVDGLLHISEISWSHIHRADDVIKAGDEIQVKIIAISGEKISLSMKALTENPLTTAIQKYKVDDEVQCTILRHEAFGTFVEIEPGVEGLIPISLMPKRRRTQQSPTLKLGDIVTARIVKIDEKSLKISLSLQDDEVNAWFREIADLEEGMEVTGTIQNVSEHGIFIGLKENVTGLLPQSKVKRAKLTYKPENVGDPITVKIIKIDTEMQRLSLEPLGYVGFDDYYDDGPSDDTKRPPRKPGNSPRQGSYDRPQRDRKSSSYKSRSENRGSDKDHSGDSDWKKYATDYQSVPEDNPFNKLK